MSDTIEIIAKRIVDGDVVEEIIVSKTSVTKVTSIDDLGFNHQQQIDLLKGCQESLLKFQADNLYADITSCPKCNSKLKFAGSVLSQFHSVFSDHKVPVKRKKCCNKDCGWTSVPSISSLFNTNVHPDLSKLQTEMSAQYSYRSAEKIMNAMSYYSRKVNNHKHLHRTVETVGNYISDNQEVDLPEEIHCSEELICQVDGGHLKSKEEGVRSFEALTSVIYSATNIKYSEKKIIDISKGDTPPRGEIISKHCAASALADDLATIKKQTLIAAQKQGMTIETTITALCDGAANCWNVVESLEDQCKEIIKILDWFHIGMKFKNISLPQYLSKKLDKIKWCIWNGLIDEGLSRYEEIIEKTRSQKMKDRVIKLKNYLINNRKYLVNYAERYRDGKIITSSLAESNVENLINKRCKGKQHMKWTREGVHPLLQVRAAIASNDWILFGRKYVLNSTTANRAA